MVRGASLVLLALGVLALGASADGAAKNPIRKVVTMLQNMKAGVEEEAKKEQGLFDKFMCYCSNGAGSLETAIATGRSQVDALTSKIESETALKSQLQQDLVQHKSDRAAAEATIKESTEMRSKEAAEFAASSGEMKANLESMSGALAALKKGLGVAMLQTNTANLLRNLVRNSPAVREGERDTLLSFLDASSGERESMTGSDQIIGIVAQMKETMEGDLEELTRSEAESKASFSTLTETKTKEIAAASTAIEQKTVRSGEVAVSATQAKADLEDTNAALEDDVKFKASLESSCKTKQAEWDARSKIRAEEIAAISETIEILNGDDALDLFKKTMPSPGGALIQFDAVSEASGRVAMTIRRLLRHDAVHSVNLRMILMMLKSKSGGGIDAVVKMVDNMIAVLGKEQADDDTKRDYCMAELAKAQDEEKGLKGVVANMATEISEKEDDLETVKAEIEALHKGIADLDKMVAEATEQRKEEHSDYTEVTQSNSAALQLIEMAKNRMNKFYNPTLYKAPPTTTVADSPYGFVQISVHRGTRADPGPAPETFSGEYKKSEGSTGIIAMMEEMARDIENDSTEAKHEEMTTQKDYEETMADAAGKRAEDSKLIVEKESAKAAAHEQLASMREGISTKRTQLGNAGDKLNDLHISCDAFLQDYDEVKKDRAAEMDQLKQSKSVLAGASAGLLQKK